MNKKVDHAFIYSDGVSIQVRLTGGATAGFPGATEESLEIAKKWAAERAETIEVRT